MRWATLVLLLVGCNDLRDFRGTWHGARIPTIAAMHDAPPLRVGQGDAARLTFTEVAEHKMAARLTVDGLLPETEITSLPGADADVLAGITFSGAPLRVYLAFALVPDGGGQALVVIALYDDRRVEVRLLRGAPAELYAIFALSEAPASPRSPGAGAVP